MNQEKHESEVANGLQKMIYGKQIPARVTEKGVQKT
jgi:hypothetical protein